MRLLVTRPQPDADIQAERLAALGHEAVLSPVIEVGFPDPGPLPLEGAQALVVTSANALRALQCGGRLKDALALPLFAVGGATAELARKTGFAPVTAGAGSAESLLPVVASACAPDAGPLVHLAGERRAWDLKGALESTGFTVHRPVVYRTMPVERFAAPVVDAMKAGALGGVILMSPFSATTYAQLVRGHELEDRAVELVHFCLSAKVARALESLEGLKTSVPDIPAQEDLLALIGRDAAN